MKKTTVFFLILGVLLMIIGGIGAVAFYQRAEHSMITHKNEEHQIKNKKSLEEIHLNLSGNASYVIQTEDIDKILMETSFGTSSSIDSSLKVEEQANRLMISTSGKQSSIELNNFKIGLFFDDFNPQVTITIPQNAKKLIITGSGSDDVYLSDVTAQDLSVNLKHSDLSFGTTNTEKLSVSLTTGDVHLYGANQSNEISVSTKFGDIDVSDLSIAKLSASTGTGNITLNQITGESTLETSLGDISASNIKGEASVTIGTGDFDLTGSNMPKKLKVSTNLGSISIYPEEILYSTSIKASSTLGDITLYGKDQSDYKQGKANRTFDLSTKTGDILVEGPSASENN